MATYWSLVLGIADNIPLEVGLAASLIVVAVHTISLPAQIATGH